MLNKNQSPYIGRPVEEVMKELKERGCPVRIRDRDGKGYMGTMDCRPQRYNLSVNKDIVVAVSMG